jgi:hypothetical protein
MVAGVAAGARPLADLAQNLNLDDQDVLANAVALSAASMLAPVEKTALSVANLDRVLFARLAGPEPVEVLALPHGTGVRIRSELMNAILQEDRLEVASLACIDRERDGPPSPASLRAWRAFLCSQGAMEIS